MALEHVLLGLLRKPANGYQLKDKFNHSLRHFWAADLAQIYPTLKRLEQQGLLKSRRQASDKGPPRKIYRRTRKGERVLNQWISEGPETGRDRIGYLAQVFFLDQLGDLRAAHAFLVALRAQTGERLAALRAIETGWASSDPRYPDRLQDADFFPQLTLRMGLMKLAAIDRWCQESIERVEHRIARRSVKEHAAEAGE